MSNNCLNQFVLHVGRGTMRSKFSLMLFVGLKSGLQVPSRLGTGQWPMESIKGTRVQRPFFSVIQVSQLMRRGSASRRLANDETASACVSFFSDATSWGICPTDTYNERLTNGLAALLQHCACPKIEASQRRKTKKTKQTIGRTSSFCHL